MSPNTPHADTPGEDSTHVDAPVEGLSRRGLFGLASAGVAGLALGGATGASIAAAVSSPSAGAAAASYPFDGAHQTGIVTAAQDRLHFAAFDMSSSATRDDLIELLQDWSFAARRLMQGLEVSPDTTADTSLLAPPDDTGETIGLPASGLTITIGFGPTLFVDVDGNDRYGIADRKPDALTRLPLFSGDALVPAQSGGDLCIQACSDDPQVAVHAIRNLSRIAFGRAVIRWSQLGFGRTSSTSTTQATPRNLFGFKDGTANIKSEDTATVDDFVWVAEDGPAWLAGGSYLVARKIRMIIESWDRTSLGEQEAVIGRDKVEGAPLSGGTEFTAPNFDAFSSTGGPAIPVDAHVRLSHPSALTSKAQLLRRGYNFVDGNDELGRLNAGLFFISYQRSPQQFIDVQNNLALDALNEYIKHVGSAIFAIPPGSSMGGYVGETLFAS